MDCGRLKRELCLLAWVLLGGPVGFTASPQARTPASSPPVLSQVLRGVENKYNRMKSMQVRFQQIFRQGQRTVRREEGTLYLSKPGRMRWEYETPEPKLFLSDGRRLVLYVPAENRVTETSIKQSEDLRAPLRFLLGNLRFDEEFGRFETSPQLAGLESGNIAFKAFPKRLGDRLEWVLFEVTPQHQIRRVIANEVGGVQTEFRFEAEQSNPSLAQGLFQFTPPAGAEVVRE